MGKYIIMGLLEVKKTNKKIIQTVDIDYSDGEMEE